MLDYAVGRSYSRQWRVRTLSTDPIQILLVRHGETHRNLEQEGVVGGGNSPLTETGRAQMRATARALRGTGFWLDEIHSSKLDRAVSSARILLEGLGITPKSMPPRRDARLNELCAGSLEGKRKSEALTEEIRAQMKLLGAAYCYPGPGGQSLNHKGDQMHDWLMEQVARWNAQNPSGKPRCVVVVTHGHAIRSLRMKLFGVDPTRARWLTDVANGSVTRIDWTSNGAVEMYVNRLPTVEF